MSVFEHGEQGGTFNGSPLMTAVGVAVLERMLAPGFLEEVAASGRYLSERLAAMVERARALARAGLGPPAGGGPGRRDRRAVVAYARDRLEKHPGWENAGLLLNAPRPELLRFMPALNVTRDEMDRMLDGLRLAIEAVR